MFKTFLWSCQGSKYQLVNRQFPNNIDLANFLFVGYFDQEPVTNKEDKHITVTEW